VGKLSRLAISLAGRVTLASGTTRITLGMAGVMSCLDFGFKAEIHMKDELGKTQCDK